MLHHQMSVSMQTVWTTQQRLSDYSSSRNGTDLKHRVWVTHTQVENEVIVIQPAEWGGGEKSALGKYCSGWLNCESLWGLSRVYITYCVHEFIWKYTHIQGFKLKYLGYTYSFTFWVKPADDSRKEKSIVSALFIQQDGFDDR